MPTQLRTLTPEPTILSDDTLRDFRADFRGSVIGPLDSEYEQACVVQNGVFRREPGLVLRCHGTADVVDAVELARARRLLVAVRGGGHSVAGHSSCAGGLLIDLSGMRAVSVDPRRGVVRAQGGATWSDVDREAQLFGLAVPGGIVSTTGVGGLTLGGGIGWLHRAYGLTCDNLRAVELVTADGRVVHADDEHYPELMWGLRGGGGNFGIVTAFEFDAHPLGPTVMDSTVIYDAGDADALFRRWRDWADTVPDEVTTRALFWTMPADPTLPPELHDRDVLILAALYAGDVESGQRVLDPIARFGTPVADLSGPAPYRLAQSSFDVFFPKGELLSYWKSIYLDELTDDVVELVLRRSRQRPHPWTMVHLPLLGGAMKRVDAEATAFGDRHADYMLSVDGNWFDPSDSARVTEWVRETVAEAAELPAATGTYLNFSGDTEVDESVRRAAFGTNLRRLTRLKTEYDPDNLFRSNSNIPPE
ncbi:FAD/FMN-containing dehydrogenase [Actinopolyspora lacussalsi]|nr:FAD/FMN-containing dehydrogenase [Actinopolyspora lacussalsi]